LAGTDGVGRRTAPLGEFFHPLPLVALVLLGLNDHLFKGSGLLPARVTGKLSDVCGLCFFPLLLTAGSDCLVWLLARRRDFSLRRWKLVAAVLATGAVFTALKLSPAAARALDGVLGGHTVADPTDLWALISLGAAYWVGTREIARVPLGRLEAIERKGARTVEEVEAALADVAARRGREAVRRLAEPFARWLGGEREAKAEAEAALAELRR